MRDNQAYRSTTRRARPRYGRMFAMAAMLAALLSTAPLTGASASTIVIHYQNPSLAGIAGHTATDGTGIPVNQTVCYAYGVGHDALDETITWQVQDFTGLAVANKSLTQRGVDNGWYGSNACQVSGTSMGFQLHKDSGTDANPVGDIYGMQLAHRWDHFLIKPWLSTSYGTDAKLRLQSNYNIEASDRMGNGIVQYGQLFVSLADTVNHKSIWYVIFLWDSRGVQPEVVMPDFGGTSNYNVVTHIQPGARYATPHPHSQLSNGSGSNNWYAAYVTRDNLLNAVQDINAAFPGAGFSTNPDHYAINFIGSGTEMYAPSGTTGWMGSRVSDVIALTEYE